MLAVRMESTEPDSQSLLLVFVEGQIRTHPQVTPLTTDRRFLPNSSVSEHWLCFFHRARLSDMEHRRSQIHRQPLRRFPPWQADSSTSKSQPLPDPTHP